MSIKQSVSQKQQPFNWNFIILNKKHHQFEGIHFKDCLPRHKKRRIEGEKYEV
jgi:hypothetical protein